MGMMRENWMVLAILGVVLMAFGGVVLLPQHRQMGQLRSQISQADRQLQDGAARFQALPDMVRQVESAKLRFGAVDRRLPQRKEVADVLRDITTAVAEEKINITSVNTQYNDDVFTMFATIEIKNMSQLNHILNRLMSLRGVINATKAHTAKMNVSS